MPFRVNGALRTGRQYIAMNRAYQRFGKQPTMQQFVNRYLNEGATSPLYGKRRKLGFGNLEDGNEPPTELQLELQFELVG